MKNIISKINIKYLHIIIILLGIVLIALPIFHSNSWFDESYSIAMAKHSFIEIWQIGATDVHPVFYYVCLHILNLIFGNNIIVYRMFSVLAFALLGILGYTHIRKDFGEKTGLLFSFLALLLPVAGSYAGEIRMYSLGLLLGSLMCIYAHRIYKGDVKKTTYIFFGLSSLLVSYTHYYGLMLAGIINLLLFAYLCKNAKTRKTDLKKFIITAVIQVIAYLPWLICFIKQLQEVSHGFWISLSFPGTLYSVLTMQYKGNLENAPIILTTLLYCYIMYLVFKTKKEERKPATWGFAIYIAIIAIALIISLCMQSVILLDRYLLIITGVLIFGLAFFMAKETKTWRMIAICSIITIMSVISQTKAIQENYHEENKNVIAYMQNNIKQGDIIVYSGAINGAVVTTELSDKVDNQSYFYNKDNWPVKESYKAFGPYMQITDTLEQAVQNYTGRIWLVEGYDDYSLHNEMKEKYHINSIEERKFWRPYKNYTFRIELIEKYE